MQEWNYSLERRNMQEARAARGRARRRDGVCARALPLLAAVLARVHMEETPLGADAFQLPQLARRLPSVPECRRSMSCITALRGSVRQGRAFAYPGNLPFGVLQNARLLRQPITSPSAISAINGVPGAQPAAEAASSSPTPPVQNVELLAQLWASFVAEAAHVEGRPEVFSWRGRTLTQPTISEDGFVSIFDDNTREVVFQAQLPSSDLSQIALPENASIRLPSWAEAAAGEGQREKMFGSGRTRRAIKEKASSLAAKTKGVCARMPQLVSDPSAGVFALLPPPCTRILIYLFTCLSFVYRSIYFTYISCVY